MHSNNPTRLYNDLYDWLRLYWPALLVLLAFLGFISKSLFQYPVAIMALSGLYLVIRHPARIWHDLILKRFTLIFLCLWLPLLIALMDAYETGRAARTVFGYLRFYLAGIFIIHSFTQEPRRLRLVTKTLAFLVAFWCIDAGIQFFLGRDLLGYPSIPGHMAGMFYPELHLPHICSILAPFLFLFIYNKQEQKLWPLLLILPLFFIILLAGRRATWLMLGLNTLGFLLFIFIASDHKKYLLKLSAIATFLVTTVLTTTIIFHDHTRNRLEKTMGLFSGDYETIDKATSKRLPIWETAINIIKAHPVNGVGPRSFRYAYKKYTTPDNYYSSQTHPHLFLLEIVTETGLIGFVGYAVLYFLLILTYIQHKQRTAIFPFLLPALVALFPLNTHMAFYGSLWSTMAWLLIILFMVSCQQVISQSGPNKHQQ